MIILYGSETGTAQDVAERIWRESKLLGIDASIKAMDDYTISNLIYEKIAIFVVSTTGQGDTPFNMKKSWRFLLRKNLPSNSLLNLRFGVLGLGDSSFVYFNVVAKRLAKRLKGLSAKPLCPIGLADDQHDLGQDAVLVPWINNLWEVLTSDGYQNNISRMTRLSSSPDLILRWNAEICQEMESNPIKINFGSGGKKYQVQLISNERTTPKEHFQDVRLIKFKSLEPNLEYYPGDVAIVMPENSVENVEKFLSLLSSPNREEKLFGDTVIKLENVYSEMPVPEALQHPFTLYECTKKFWDLNCSPRRYMFQVMAQVTDNELERDKLLELSSTEGQEELFNYCYRPRRTVLEVLRDFPHVMKDISLKHLFEMLQPIRPRHFSIASSPIADNDLQLLVAVVRYKTKLVAPRVGLCSTWLSSLYKGYQMEIAIRKGSLAFPVDSDTPVVMVGPGTGIAPFRSFILTDLALLKNLQKNQRELILFFGCRNMKADFHFENDLSRPEITLFTAFSRDQPHKMKCQQHASSCASFFNKVS
ncbi:NADPH-dependent diflavin oxidoreductase 1 isoform X2 [Cimex lectularius]|uniref:NADPH-dependent diflavin oxidoreductase 1 n=1 Tax=Cimex lectularius TaxID=79782 RepID=A0A8I6RV65_CIMLE|nr:NADPH-dependent diflavin oxidoreductase 1 isoform X2 [Cimex lectularius]